MSESKREEVQVYGDPSARTVILLLGGDSEGESTEEIIQEVSRITGRGDFCLAVMLVQDWNDELAPWTAPPVFGKQGFGNGAAETLKKIREEVLPPLRQEEQGQEREGYLCGYSLAGLFSLWAGYQTGEFAGIIAVSPSVWYPGWLEYAGNHKLQTEKVYLSLGDREEKARNRTLAQVGFAIREMDRILEEAQVSHCLEWNEGNHFVDSEKRIARGISWMLVKQ